ncbi:MAG: serine hydrolase domain-containing protein [Bacteroidales bacterium]
MKQLFIRSLTIMSVLLLLFSCTKDDVIPTPELSDSAYITGVSFSVVNNPELTKTVSSYKIGTTFYISVPTSGDITKLKANYDISKGAKVYINDIEQTNGEIVQDFSNLVNVKVISESGEKTANYVVYAKYGDADIDASVYKFMSDYSIPGVSVSVMKGEEIIYSSGYGFAVVETNTKATSSHLFRLASVSKQFTTLCIMTLYERGLLNIDRNVFGPGGILDSEFPGVTGTKATVTVRNFLQHNSGWPTDPDPMFTNSIRDGKTMDDLIRYILAQELSSAPGSKYAYYNMGFGILGKVVEKISGMEYEAFLKQEVLKPMGITDIHVGGGQNERLSNECVYYSQSGTNGYGNPMSVIAAAGGIIASTDQMMSVLAHIDGKDGVPDILKPETLDLMYNSPTDNYARYSLGWRIGHSLYPGAHYHSGNLAGTTAMWIGDSNGMSVAILCNSRSYISGYDDSYYILLSNIISYFR